MQPTNFPYKEEIMSVNPTCLVVIILLFISIILAFKVSALLCIKSTSGHGWNVPWWEAWLQKRSRAPQTRQHDSHTKQSDRHYGKKRQKIS